MIVGFQIANHRMMEILGSSFLTLIKYTLNSLPLHTINFKKGLRQDNKHSTKCLKNADGSKMTLMLKFAQKCQKCFKNVKNCSKIPFFLILYAPFCLRVAIAGTISKKLKICYLENKLFIQKTSAKIKPRHIGCSSFL